MEKSAPEDDNKRLCVKPVTSLQLSTVACRFEVSHSSQVLSSQMFSYTAYVDTVFGMYTYEVLHPDMVMNACAGRLNTNTVSAFSKTM